MLGLPQFSLFSLKDCLFEQYSALLNAVMKKATKGPEEKKTKPIILLLCIWIKMRLHEELSVFVIIRKVMCDACEIFFSFKF